MRGDFSRDTFDPTRHYNAVLMQQGRVQTDADWNEQSAITRYLAQSATADLAGACGTPREREGFRLTPGGAVAGDYRISAGHYYVDGILCENEAAVLASAQTSLITTAGDSNQLLSPALPAQPGVFIAYLDVWQRHITALDDDLLREKALGGPDTTSRSQTIWQVKLLPIIPDQLAPAPFARQFRTWQDQIVALRRSRTDEPFQRTLQALQDLITSQLKPLDDANAAQETVDPRTIQAMIKAQQTLVESLLALPGGTDATRAQVQQLSDDMVAALTALFPPLRCGDQADEWDALVAPSTGRLRARVNPAETSDDPCDIPPGSAYRGQENQLYRVEIHAGGTLNDGSTISFKWSRENGSVVTAVRATAELNGTTDVTLASIPVQDTGPDSVLGFSSGQWVELVDELSELNGQPGQLRQITAVSPATRQIELDQPVTLNIARRPKLRRWDSLGAVDVATAAQPIALEAGIEVIFEAGSYRTGEYWLIPARTATGGIEWPTDPTVTTPTPAALPARGPTHHICPLAIAQYDGEDMVFVDDCRVVFPSLADLAPPEAFHVVQTNWANDDLLPADQFLNLQGDGLIMRFDAPPDPAALSGATLIVSLEPSLAAGFPLEGTIEVVDKTVRWRLTDQTLAAVGQLNLFQAGRPAPRVRVVLNGRSIWASGPELQYLDGQAFGLPGLRADGKTPAVMLHFPSGDNARASNFESWFYLAQVQRAATPLRVQTVSFLGIARGAEATIATIVLGRGTPDVPVMKVSEQVSFIEITFSRDVNVGPVDDGILPSIRLEALTQEPGTVDPRGGLPTLPIETRPTVPRLPRINLASSRLSDVSGSQAAASADDIIRASKTNISLSDQLQTFTRVKVTPVPSILATNAEVVRLRMRPTDIRTKLQPFPAATYRVVISGDASDSVRAVTAADDKTALDGDFDGKPGGTLSLGFQIQ